MKINALFIENKSNLEKPLTVKELYRFWKTRYPKAMSNELVFCFNSMDGLYGKKYMAQWGWITEVIPPELSEPEGDEPYGADQAFSNKMTFVCSRLARYGDSPVAGALNADIFDRWLSKNVNEYGNCELWCKKNFEDTVFNPKFDKNNGYSKMPNMTVPVAGIYLDPQEKTLSLADYPVHKK